MATCPNCGAEISAGSKFCSYCGTNLNAVNQAPAVQPQSNYYNNQNSGYNYSNNQNSDYSYNSQNSGYSYNSNQGGFSSGGNHFGTPQPMSTGGLMAWSIITLLLCTIPGIVAITKTSGINKAQTAQEQQARYKSAKTWCIVGTVLGTLYLILSIAGM